MCRETGTKVDVVTRHQYGILRQVFTHHFAGKPVVASRNVGCFFGLRVILIFFFEYEQNEKNTVTYQCDVELQRVKKESEELSKDLADERKAHDTLRSVPRKPIT